MNLVLLSGLLSAPAFISAPQNVHGAITQEAASSFSLSSHALKEIVEANYRQDKDEVSLDFTIGKSWFVPNKNYMPAHHFDRNEGDTSMASFKRGAAFVREQQALASSKITSGDLNGALKSIGRACHSLQDLYSHSNYIDLTKSDQAQTIVALWSGSHAPPTALLMTGYAKATGKRIPGDTYSHEDHCKDGIISLGVKKIPQGESAHMHASGKSKYEVARAFAVASTADLLRKIRTSAGAAWVRVQKF